MSELVAQVKPTDARLFQGRKPTWCPGCGDFGVLNALKRAWADMGLTPDGIVLVSGIGCSGRINSYVKCYAFHTTHGRTLPVATGVKLANHELEVFAIGGDGDGYAIGMGHFIHAVRRNTDITYVVMDNEVYGLTKGQTSPTAPAGFKTKTTPGGSIEYPVEPLALAMVAGCTFVAQGFSGDTKQLTELLKEGVKHRGFALVNIMSPCVTYNKTRSYDYVRERVAEVPGSHKRDDLRAALDLALDAETIYTGILYQTDRPTYNGRLCPETPVVKQDVTKGVDVGKLLEEFA